MLANVIVIFIIAALVTGACAKIIIDKRNGIQCTGCPCSKVEKEKCTCSNLSSCGSNLGH